MELRMIENGSRVKQSLYTITAVLLTCGVTNPAKGQGGPCGEWEQVSTPNPGLFRNSFIDADADSGSLFELLRSVDQDGSAAPVTYRLLRRDAVVWTDLGEPSENSVPNPPAYRALGVGPNEDVWLGGAVAWHQVIAARPAMVRWNASSESWDDPEMIELMPMTVFPFTDRGGSVEAIDVAPDGTVFAVGLATAFGNGLDGTVPLFLINDGSGWEEIADPDFNWPGSRGATVLYDVLAFSSDNVWAVGRHPTGQGIGAGGLIVHWDGTNLELIEEGGLFLSRDLGGIAGNAPDDMWVVGDGSAAGGPTATLAHFDGSDWTLAPSPYANITALNHIAIAGDGTAWATGVFADVQEAYFDGMQWTLESFATANSVRVQRMARDGDGVLWAVGDINFTDSFAQRLACQSSETPAPLTDFDVIFGQHIAGGLNELTTSDDLFLTAASQFGFSASEPNVVDLRVGAMSTIAMPSTLSIVIESRLNNAGGLAKVRLRNWDTASFEQVTTYAVGTQEIVSEFPSLDATNRVRASDQRIELSTRVVVVATFSLSGFRAYFDQITIEVE